EGGVHFDSLETWTEVGSPTQLPAGHSLTYPRGMSFAPDGGSLVVGYTGLLYRIDVATHVARRIAGWPKGWSIADAAYALDGSTVAVGLEKPSSRPDLHDAGKLVLIDPATGRTIWHRAYPLGPAGFQGGWSQLVLAYQPHHPRRLVTSSDRDHTFVWDAMSGR